MRLFLIINLLFWQLLFVHPISAATAVNASRLIVRTEPGQIESRDLVISNLSRVSQQYRLSMDEGNMRLASFIPSDFNLGPKQSQNVLVRFRQGERSRQTHLAILAYDARQSGNLKVASGIKIPVYFIVTPGKSPLLSEEGVGGGGRGAVNTLFSGVYTLYAIDLILFFIVCFLWQRRLFWRRTMIRHKISFI